MTSDLTYAINPTRWAKEQLGFTPDPWQARVLESSRNVLLNIHRQGGKSQTCSVMSLWRAIHYPKSLILVLSPSLRQSGELYRKISDLMSLLSNPPKLEEDNRLSCVFSNKSRIVSLPGTSDTIRCFSNVDLIILDEAARIPDELYLSVRPMIAVSGGRLVMASTPAGRRGVFFDAWQNGGDAWERIEVPASECPRISQTFLNSELAALGPYFYDQEYFCQFNDVSGSCFSYDMIREAMCDDIEPLFPVLSADSVRYIPEVTPIDYELKPLFEEDDEPS